MKKYMHFVLISLLAIIIRSNCLIMDRISVEETGTINIRLKSGQLLIGNHRTVKEFEKNDALFDTVYVYEFLGLPFAQPPLDEKRYQFPHDLPSIFPGDVYDATYARPSCIQELDLTLEWSQVWNPPGEISEDCLYMNIWVPVTKNQDALLRQESNKASVEYVANGFGGENSDKATLYWFYGGSYYGGSASLSLYNGTVLAALENLIVASSNYRLGPLGFLYLNSSEAPGNAGLADSVKSIEWYRDYYLELFGGSDKKVCLFGESAGAFSLEALLVSEKNHLFSRIVMQSASAHLDLAYTKPEDSLLLGKYFANKVGCNSTDSNEILKCMLKVDASALSAKQFEIIYVNEFLKMPFVLTSDYHQLIKTEPAKFNYSANQQIQHQVLAGTNQNEGTFFEFYLYLGKYFDENNFFYLPNVTYNNKFASEILAESLRTTTFRSEAMTAAEKRIDDVWFNKYVGCLNDLYTKTGKTVSANSYHQSTDDFDLDSEYNRKLNSPETAWKKITKILGDLVFTCPVVKFVDAYKQGRLAKAFFYRFNTRARSNPWPKWLGVMHGYEIEYEFGVPWSRPELYMYEDRLISSNLMSYLGNFAKTGKLYSEYDAKYLEFGREYFVDFSPETFNLRINISERDEWNHYRKINMMCGLFNKFESEDSYETKYKECARFSESVGSSGAMARPLILSGTLAVLLSVFF